MYERIVIETVEKLNDLLVDMTWDTEQNYFSMCDIVFEYENNNGRMYLIDMLTDYNFVTADEEVMELLMEQNSSSISRMRYFIGETEEADVYRVDGYGNLENIDNDFLKDVIEEFLELLEEEYDEAVEEELEEGLDNE